MTWPSATDIGMMNHLKVTSKQEVLSHAHTDSDISRKPIKMDKMTDSEATTTQTTETNKSDEKEFSKVMKPQIQEVQQQPSKSDSVKRKEIIITIPKVEVIPDSDSEDDGSINNEEENIEVFEFTKKEFSENNVTSNALHHQSRTVPYSAYDSRFQHKETSLFLQRLKDRQYDINIENIMNYRPDTQAPTHISRNKESTMHFGQPNTSDISKNYCGPRNSDTHSAHYIKEQRNKTAQRGPKLLHKRESMDNLNSHTLDTKLFYKLSYIKVTG